jgi:Zn-dependent protease
MNLHLSEALLNVLLLWILTAPHEFAHAWVAMRLGDNTARDLGRVTLNPLAHVDWVGTAILPFVTSLLGGGFLGWGKPVPTDPSRLRGGLNGLALVSLAGPFSNLVFAVILAAVATATQSVLPPLAHFAVRGVELSIYLALINMIPIPPLDGSKLLLAARVPVSIYIELSRYGFFLLVAALSFSDVGRWLSVWSYQATLAIFTLMP